MKRSKANIEGASGDTGTLQDISTTSAAGGKTQSGEGSGPKKRDKFTSLFNARYGSVVEFMESEDEDEGKLFNRRSGTQWSKKTKKNQGGDDAEDSGRGGRFRRGGGRGGVKVVGTMSRCKLALLTQP